MKYGITLPYGSARLIADLAQQAEIAGWDGVFVGDAIWCVDPLIQLAAAAMVTSRIRLGTMILATPLRIPWQTAGQAAALDNLSQGRLVLGLGTGATWMGWSAFPDVPLDVKTRAEMLDETVDLLTMLFRREPFDFDGRHYHLKLTTLDVNYYPPKPAQHPRPPLWVVGVWPRKKSMERVLRADGLLPNKIGANGQPEEITPADVCEMQAYIEANRTLTTPFDIVVEGSTAKMSALEMQEKVGAYREAGATWWIEGTWTMPEGELPDLIRRGPPSAQ